MRRKTALDIITEKRASAQPPVKPIGGFLGRNAPVLTNSTALSMVRNRLAQIASGRNKPVEADADKADPADCEIDPSAE
jgi:hypothetical protein